MNEYKNTILLYIKQKHLSMRAHVREEGREEGCTLEGPGTEVRILAAVFRTALTASKIIERKFDAPMQEFRSSCINHNNL